MGKLLYPILFSLNDIQQQRRLSWPASTQLHRDHQCQSHLLHLPNTVHWPCCTSMRVRRDVYNEKRTMAEMDLLVLGIHSVPLVSTKRVMRHQCVQSIVRQYPQTTFNQQSRLSAIWSMSFLWNAHDRKKGVPTLDNDNMLRAMWRATVSIHLHHATWKSVKHWCSRRILRTMSRRASIDQPNARCVNAKWELLN